MGNCQAVDAAALVIQHPNGRIERMYWSVSASEVMKMNPGHYVSLIIPLPSTDEEKTVPLPSTDEEKTVRFTRVKLLRSSDTLVLGRAYRLVTSQGWFLFCSYQHYIRFKLFCFLGFVLINAILDSSCVRFLGCEV